MPHLDGALVQAYIDGFCADAKVIEVEAHLKACATCLDRVDEAYRVAEQASQLLDALQPGPVHAPTFAELQQRAQEVPADEKAAAAALNLARAATATVQPSRPRWSVQPLLAWAATLVLAFGVGWFSGSGVDGPADLGPVAASAPEFDAPRQEAAADDLSAADAEPTDPAASELAPGPAASMAEAELDDAVAKRRLDSIPESSAEPAASPPAAVLGQRSQAAGVAGAATNEQRVAEEQVSANAPAAPSAAPARERPADAGLLGGELNEAFAAPTDFVAIDRRAAEQWLGAPPRELPDLALIRVEVGPGSLLAGGASGRAVLRLTYMARTGQEVSLVQQYNGPDVEAGFADAAQPSTGRAELSAAERERSVDELRANRKVAADRDTVAADALTREGADLPATVRDPDGTVTYTWIDENGYQMSLSGALDPDIIRGLADLIR